MKPFVDFAGAAETHLREAEAAVAALEEVVTGKVEAARRRLAELAGFEVELVDDEIEAFLEEPYCVVPAGEADYRVVVPRFVGDFHVGVLERSTDSYNVFRVNRYAAWVGSVPDELRHLFPFEAPLEATVDGRLLEAASEENRERAWTRYRGHLQQRRGDRGILVKQGREFQLIADMVADGILPFVPKPVAEEDLREPAWRVAPASARERAHGVEGFSQAITLRDYQEEAWQRFLETGAIGVYWMTGAGKTYVALYALAHVRGRKLVVVPTRTLVEQWTERLERHLAPGAVREVELITYHAWDRVRRKMNRRGFKGYKLVVYDECHRLPATTFSRFATLPVDYRIGLSATPLREDDRTDLIFALTGFPVGLDWRKLLELGVAEAPEVTLVVVKDRAAKRRKVLELVDEDLRTVVFCDSLALGEELAKATGFPFVHGATRHRLEVIREHRQVIVSRVGDEGLSLPDLDRVIEYDFHGGSRRQEVQRMGRLMHGAGRGEHWILMTEAELARHEKRLHGVREKGIRVSVVREAA